MQVLQRFTPTRQTRSHWWPGRGYSPGLVASGPAKQSHQPDHWAAFVAGYSQTQPQTHNSTTLHHCWTLVAAVGAISDCTTHPLHPSSASLSNDAVQPASYLKS